MGKKRIFDECALTNAEKRVLNILSDKKSANMSVAEICRAAKIGQTTYYKILKSPQFKEYLSSSLRQYIDQNKLQIIDVFIKAALTGSYKHGKLLLELSGDYKHQVKQDVDIKTDVKLEDIISNLNKDTKTKKE